MGGVGSYELKGQGVGVGLNFLIIRRVGLRFAHVSVKGTIISGPFGPIPSVISRR